MRQIDFKNAFLNAPMDKELYMELPPGLEFVMDVAKLARGTVCKLVRGLYGAKQSPALVPLHDDSQACIRIAGNPCLAERTKHFDVKYHWLREKVKANKIELRYISTHEQLADIFTKPLGVMQHNYLKGRLTGYIKLSILRE